MVPDSMKNPVKPLPWNEGAFDTYQKYGYLMFPQQRKIYEGIKSRIATMSTILEVGCGIGLGTALLANSLTTKIIGTDNLAENVKIARALYPWIKFEEWDITLSTTLSQRVETIVAVEVIEHVSDPYNALKNICNMALKEVWFSTPNGIGKKRPPENPHHVTEYVPTEILAMIREIPGDWELEILDFNTFERVGIDTKVDPLVYHLVRGKK